MRVDRGQPTADGRPSAASCFFHSRFLNRDWGSVSVEVLTPRTAKCTVALRQHLQAARPMIPARLLGKSSARALISGTLPTWLVDRPALKALTPARVRFDGSLMQHTADVPGHVVVAPQRSWQPRVAKAKPSRLEFVDSLRGLAALYVLLFHTVLVPLPKLVVPPWAWPFILNGRTGVALFFVISAFTLCYTLQAQLGEPQAYTRFYIRRIFRILPLYYAWLALMVALFWGLAVAIQSRHSLLLYMSLGFNFFPGKQEGLVMASWTLSLEMIFYIAFPFVFRFVTSIRTAIAYLFFSVVMASLHLALIRILSSHHDTSHYLPHLSLFYQLPVFALGILSYFVYLRIRELRVPPAFGLLLIVVGIVGFVLIPYRRFWTGESITWYAMAVDYSLMLVGLSIRPISLVVNRVAVFYGLISYSLYLNHPLIVAYFSPIFRHVYARGHAPILSLTVCFTAIVIPLTALSYLTYRFIEKPGMSLGRELTKHVGLLFKPGHQAGILPG
jgi:peptidoglycan/LPS O-acetylase OafA/YrhL